MKILMYFLFIVHLDELTSTSTTLKPISNQNKLVPSLGIKIKEITKAEEIRIVDEKPKVNYPTLKPNGNQSKLEQLSSTSSSTENPEIENIDESLNINKNTDSNEGTNNSDSSNPDTQQEKQQQQQGEEVVIVDRNGQTKPILVLGIEGLQRGDIVEEPIAVDGGKIEDSDHNQELEVAGSEINIQVSKTKPDIINKITTEGIPEESISSSTTKEVYETILYTSGPDTLEEKEITKTIFETIYHDPNESLLQNSTTENPFSSTSVLPNISPDHNQQQHHLDDDDATASESNPFYPTIPDDDLSIYGREILTEAENDDYLENNHKSKSALQMNDLKSFSEKSTTEGPNISELPKLEQNLSNSLSTEGYNINLKYGQERSPGEPLLIPEWERNSTTESINQNETEINTDNNSDEEWKNQAISVEIDPGSGSGSGFSQISSDEISSSHHQSKDIVDIEDMNEASADGSTQSINLVSENSLNNHNNNNNDDVVESRAISNLFESDNQLTNNIKLQKVFNLFHSFRKNYFNDHIF